MIRYFFDIFYYLYETAFIIHLNCSWNMNDLANLQNEYLKDEHLEE